MSIITNRHDVMVLFEVVNGNPNGDPDAGNLPRIDPTNNKGLVSDVCLKRKIRNFLIEFPTQREENGNGFNIIVKQGNIINNELDSAIKKATEKLGKEADNKKKAEAAKDWLCKEFYDIRAFGGVLSTGDDVLKGSAYGQVRGPIQFTFGQSAHPITPLEISITRCAVTKPEDEKKERTMGNKHIVPYALYVGKVFISPAFAEKTKFTEQDLNIFFEALLHMFDHDQSAARPEMNVRGIFDFEHVGTQDDKNAEQKKREARLGCYHAHKLFDGIKIDLSEDAKKKGKTYPESFGDYSIKCEWSESLLPKGVNLHLRHEGRIIQSNNGK